MFCTVCGNKILDGEKFCGKCGTPVTGKDGIVGGEAKQSNVADNQPWNVKFEEPYNDTEKQKKVGSGFKINKGLIGILVATVILSAGLITFINMHKHTINLEDYVVVEYEGCNHYGNADIRLDGDALLVDAIMYGKAHNKEMRTWKKELKEAEKEGKDTKDYLSTVLLKRYRSGGLGSEDFEPIKELGLEIKTIVIKSDVKDQLSNGDKIEIPVIFEKDLLKDYNLELAGETVTIEVAGLPEANEVDPFEKISVEYQGTSPYLTAVVTNNNEELSGYIKVSVSANNGNIKLGDKFNVVIEADEEGLLENKGIHLTALSKEYVCENADAYIESASQIPDDIMEKMRSNAEDVFRANAASNWVKEVSIKDFKLIGNYMLKSKEFDTWNIQNQIYLVFKVTVKKEGEKKFSYYYYTKYNNIMLLQDGTCTVDVSDYSVPKYNWLSNEGFKKYDLSFSGYQDLESLFNNCVTSQIDNYEYENNVQE
ncbi:MAG: zinc ribbon domain-containing protein [Lachnospiraceae bacterium]|nr:zinc ribbon domain-containing protein [Lachnospiraceae bacterium]